MIVARTIYESVTEALRYFPVVLITGARQVGKSTLAGMFGSIKEYVTLDDLSAYLGASEDPHGFVEHLPKPVVIDEIQKVPGLLPAIKKHVDSDRTSGQFLLTGSANLLAFHNVSETLAGRMAVIDLWPLSVSEKRQLGHDAIEALLHPGRQDGARATQQPFVLEEELIQGGYPEMLRMDSARARYLWFSSYIRTYVERDVRDIGQLRNLDGFIRVFSLLAARSGTLLNKSELARDAGIDQQTLNVHLEILKNTYQLATIAPFSSSRTKRTVKTPKIFFTDTGVLCHSLGIHSAQELHAAREKGAVLETFVLSELIKSLSSGRRQGRVFYFRTTDKTEIDFIVEVQGRLFALEVKWAGHVVREDFRHIHRFREQVGDAFATGIVLYTGETFTPMGTDCYAMPLSMLLEG